MPKISVIVPVYNVEMYLSECLDSLIHQSLTDIEIICINDGSTDGSQNILERYAFTDRRIKIINQKNRSLGSARNRGLMEATGQYVYFIDSDDYIDVYALEMLYTNAIVNNSDIVICKFRSFGGTTTEVGFKLENQLGNANYRTLKFTYKDVKHHVLNSAYSSCVKLYKKEFLDSYDDFYFPEQVYFEDVPFHVKVMLRASIISFVPEELYHYRINQGSISNSNVKSSDIFKVIDMVEYFLRENDFYWEFEMEFAKFKIAQILKYVFITDSDEFFTRAKEELRKIDIKDSKNLKKELIDSYNILLSSNSHFQFLSRYLNKKISDLNKENKKLKAENQRILSSTSWKITKPLRVLKKFFKL